MNRYGLAFHHLGLAVTHVGKAIRFLESLGYSHGKEILDELQNVNLIYCTCDSMPAVELIYPYKRPGPLEAILKSNQEMIYHICYATGDLDLSLAKIKAENRVITISKPKPAVLFSNNMVSFHQIAGFGLIELLETKIRCALF